MLLLTSADTNTQAHTYAGVRTAHTHIYTHAQGALTLLCHTWHFSSIRVPFFLNISPANYYFMCYLNVSLLVSDRHTGEGGKKREQEGWVKSDRREEGGKNEPERQAKGHEKEKQKRKVFCGCFGWMNASMHRHACLYRANTYVMVESVPGAKQIGGGDKQTERIISFPDLNLFHSCLSCSSYRCWKNRQQLEQKTDRQRDWHRRRLTWYLAI